MSGFQLIHDQSTSFDFVDIKPSESYEIRWIQKALKHCNKILILICDTDCFLIVSTCNTQNYFVLSSLVVPPKACFSPIYENLVILIAATVLQLYCKSSVGLNTLARRPYPYQGNFLSSITPNSQLMLFIIHIMYCSSIISTLPPKCNLKLLLM